MVLSGGTTEKIPVTPSGIDPGTVRLVAQCLNHYATPGTPRPAVHSCICDRKLTITSQQFIADSNIALDVPLSSLNVVLFSPELQLTCCKVAGKLCAFMQ